MACEICAKYPAYQPPAVDFYRIQQKRIDSSAVVLAFNSVLIIAVTLAAGVAFLELSTIFGMVGFAFVTISSIMRCCCRWEFERSRDLLLNFGLGGIFLGALSECALFSAGFLALAGTVALISTVSYLFFKHLRGDRVPYGENTDTLLTSAIKSNRIWLVKLALWLSANPNQQVHLNAVPITPLQLACHLGNRLPIVQILLNYRANPNGNGTYRSPLYLAVQRRDHQTALFLLDHHAKCTSPGNPKDIVYLAISGYGDERERLIEVEKTRLRREGHTEEQIEKMIIDTDILVRREEAERKEAFKREEMQKRKITALEGEEALQARDKLLGEISHLYDNSKVTIGNPILTAKQRLVSILHQHINDKRAQLLMSQLGIRDHRLLRAQEVR